jgi:hypothetical protein
MEIFIEPQSSADYNFIYNDAIIFRSELTSFLPHKRFYEGNNIFFKQRKNLITISLWAKQFILYQNDQKFYCKIICSSIFSTLKFSCRIFDDEYKIVHINRKHYSILKNNLFVGEYIERNGVILLSINDDEQPNEVKFICGLIALTVLPYDYGS